MKHPPPRRAAMDATSSAGTTSCCPAPVSPLALRAPPRAPSGRGSVARREGTGGGRREGEGGGGGGGGGGGTTHVAHAELHRGEHAEVLPRQVPQLVRVQLHPPPPPPLRRPRRLSAAPSLPPPEGAQSNARHFRTWTPRPDHLGRLSGPRPERRPFTRADGGADSGVTREARSGRTPVTG